jgi:hypothetical protein
MPLSPAARTGLIVGGVAAIAFLFASCGVFALIVLKPKWDRDSRERAAADAGKAVGLGDEDAARRGRELAKEKGNELAKEKHKPGDRITVAGVVTGFGAGGEDFLDAFEGAGPTNPKPQDPRGPRERHLVIAWEGPASGRTYAVRCVFPSHEDRRDTTQGARIGARVVIEGTVRTVGPPEVILSDCKMVKATR